MNLQDLPQWLAPKALEDDMRGYVLLRPDALLYIEHVRRSMKIVLGGDALSILPYAEGENGYGNWYYDPAKGSRFDVTVQESSETARQYIEEFAVDYGDGVTFDIAVREPPLRLALQHAGVEALAPVPAHLKLPTISLEAIGLPGSATPVRYLEPLVKWIEDERLIFAGADKYSGASPGDLLYEGREWVYSPRFGRYQSYAVWESYEVTADYLRDMMRFGEGDRLLDVVVVDSFEKVVSLR
jgi:hypothetical protein